MQKPKKRIIIAGGGTTGWLAALALSKQLGNVLDITLIESEEIGTIGVGEATIPPMRTFHKLLRIDEQEFMRATAATFKLGIQFQNWGNIGDSYIHAFGRNGQSTWLAEFHHFWLRGKQLGDNSDIGDYCLELQAAKQGKFATGSGVDINYAYHLDATAYARFMRTKCEALGVVRREGKIAKVEQDALSGNITALFMENGDCVEGDFFLDCTGFRALLIQKTLDVGYVDWSHWLMCDSAIAVQTESVAPPLPYTRSIAHQSGWQWRIPLQHRVGNGIVYASQFMTDEAAEMHLIANLDGATTTAPRQLRFKTGRRKQFWSKNCVALGLASGFLEPLESTSIHLVMSGITRLMQLLLLNGDDAALRQHYNDLTSAEMEKIRDFIIAHYRVNRRADAPFWRQCQAMDIPDTLQQRLELFAQAAHAYQTEGELFRVDSWVQMLIGQGMMPATFHPFAHMLAKDQLLQMLSQVRSGIAKSVSKLPAHDVFTQSYCPILH